MPWSARRINRMVRISGDVRRYLEIGVWRGETLSAVSVPEKVGVDPKPKLSQHSVGPRCQVIQKTSDQFFATLDSSARFDFVFLDGLHEIRQTHRDFRNTLAHSKIGTLILIDDVRPDNDNAGIPDRRKALAAQYRIGVFDRRWQGDVWKILVLIRRFYLDVEVALIENSKSKKDNVQAIVMVTTLGSALPNPALVEKAVDELQDVRYSDFVRGNPDLFTTVPEQIFLEEVLPEWLEMVSS